MGPGYNMATLCGFSIWPDEPALTQRAREAALAFGPELIWATAADSAQIAASELGVRRRLCCP